MKQTIETRKYYPMIRITRATVMAVLMTLVLSTGASAQGTSYNPISTAVPFLTITPDSRHGAMGDVGVATSPDASAQYQNPSKYAFAEGRMGFSLSYVPWLRQLVSDMYLASFSGYYRLDDRQAFGSSLRYYSIGDITTTGMDQVKTGTVSPNEFALDVSYSRKLSEHLSGGVALRYIRSDLTGGITGAGAGSESYRAGNAFSTDISFYHTTAWGGTGTDNTLSTGINISNIGSRISYDQGSTRDYLPANLRLGTCWSRALGESNSLGLSMDLNKLLVPTPSPGTASAGRNSQGVISSIFSSFGDAPGGMKEELQEVTLSLGAEYWYRSRLALRAGYFGEAQNKGDRKYLTAGVGLKLKMASVDVSYAMPVRQNNPLANTIRFTLNLNLGSFAPKESTPEPETPPAGEAAKQK